MKPKEKAKELVDKFTQTNGNAWFAKENDSKPSCLGAVSFSIFDKVYMDSPFGIYTGIIKDVKEGKMTIESHSPTGNGTMWAEYDIEGTEWQKY